MTITSEREKRPYYIGANDTEIAEMLKHLNLKSLDDLYASIRPEHKFTTTPKEAPVPLDYEKLKPHLQSVSEENMATHSFLGDGLVSFAPSEIVGDICGIRGLTTAYTPYQPERSQGTLKSLWIYQSLLSELTGMEAINASLYERATCLFEAIQCALRCAELPGSAAPKGRSVLLTDDLYPGDKEVLLSLAKYTALDLHFVSVDPATGFVCTQELSELMSSQKFAAVVFSQTNTFGLLTPVHTYTDLASQHHLLSIAIVDPILLASSGLTPPNRFGSQQQGADIIVAEGQSLALDSNFGGPGLGIFGIRYNERTKNFIRTTPGRFVGKACDQNGFNCETLILSTREQHIRREKATSNICSNQSFVASLAGANLLYWGAEGLAQKVKTSKSHATQFWMALKNLKGVELGFPSSPSFHELTLKCDRLPELLEAAKAENLELGVDVSGRLTKSGSASYLKMTFTDKHQKQDIERAVSFFEKFYATSHSQASWKNLCEIPSNLLREPSDELNMPRWDKSQVIGYYQKLGELNLTPDDGIYPLGSCTMKYNPYINDWAAALPGFTQIHPQTDVRFCQGNLRILFETQNFFKTITGLSAVTTQPVAGAQGELVGLKMFQAYFDNKGEREQRQVLLIPKSAHGTNPATATVAGFSELVIIAANAQGQIDVQEVERAVQTYGTRIAGAMITNPNTSGIFESEFKQVSDLVHSVGGLVYMDGANMNAIAGHVDLGALGVKRVVQ